MTNKENRKIRIKAHIRKTISGTAERPRLTVSRSNKQIYAQLIDDVEGKTLAAASSLAIKDKEAKKEIAAKVGEELAKVATAKGIKSVVFDRNGYLYHGRVQSLADGARKGGLIF